MSREAHVRICGSVGVRFPCATRPDPSLAMISSAISPRLHHKNILFFMMIFEKGIVCRSVMDVRNRFAVAVAQFFTASFEV